MAATVATDTTPWWDEVRRDRTFVIGVDLGQSQDFTALVVLERFLQPLREADTRGNQRTELRHEVRYLERPALGTPYPVIVERVTTLMRSPALNQWKKKRLPNGDRESVLVTPDVVVDRTGVGAPIVDLLTAAKLSPIAVTITGGNEQTQPAHRHFHVPKRDLVSTLLVAFQNRKLLIAKGLPLTEVLAAELRNFRAKINIVSGHDSYESWRENQHDDLLLASAIAFWWSHEQHRHAFAKSRLLGF
jgi:hypothetical protein